MLNKTKNLFKQLDLELRFFLLFQIKLQWQFYIFNYLKEENAYLKTISSSLPNYSFHEYFW